MSLPPQTNVPTFFQYLGIPTSWLHKRPKLPSRNWLIFLSFTFSTCGLYTYDRRKCKEIRQSYINKVQHLSEEPLSSTAFSRKVTPILVAAAVDYDIVKGKRHGSLAELIAEKTKSDRRINLDLDPPPVSEALGIPGHSREEERKRFLEGGIIIIGRHTFKEFMNGLKRGWTEPLDIVDKEASLSTELENDGVFDDDDDLGFSSEDSKQNRSALLLPPTSIYHSPPSLKTTTTGPLDPRLKEIPDQIPPYPPILLVHFRNLVGFKYIPLMIWEFFNRRRDVQRGAEAAYRLITGSTRPLRGPSEADGEQTSPESDLSFDIDVENFYKSTSLPSDIEKARKSYYETLRQKIKTARELAHHEREPTKDERNFPPPTEVELRAQRIEKELKWRSDVAGWQIINPDSPVDWDPRFTETLSVYNEYVSEK
ncbi:hypothetical protein Clacol_006583 [Clathrus columnatus]|uniref:Mitochondrial import inner membrane translocase subunit TIM54 n=1 Tax=Clathrus columnatus TaxID=1419009 RepID=A0AAV5AFA7_9AGAM|nr:hypothetical protein Clacol_006583 [Clathrus columnatus]